MTFDEIKNAIEANNEETTDLEAKLADKRDELEALKDEQRQIVEAVAGTLGLEVTERVEESQKKKRTPRSVVKNFLNGVQADSPTKEQLDAQAKESGISLATVNKYTEVNDGICRLNTEGTKYVTQAA